MRRKKPNIAIVTAVVGCDIDLFDPPVVYSNVDYFAFVDREHDVNHWKQLSIYEFSCDSVFSERRNAKIFKILPDLFLPDYQYYIWVDATHAVLKDPVTLIHNFLSNSDIAVFQHSQRNCIYDEAKVVLNLGYDHSEKIFHQMKFYKESNYPKNNGLYELSAFIRRNTSIISCLNIMWWEQICMFSSRDQLSFPFVLNRCNIHPNIIPGRVNDPFAFKTHKPVTNDFLKQIRFSNHKRCENNSN